MNKKIVAGLMACAVLVGAAVGGTIAWLTDTTDKVENTFTVGDVNISLTETDAVKEGEILKKNYDFVPGDRLSKDPKVTVKAKSEKCYLFIKVTEMNNACTLSKNGGDSEDRNVDPLIIWEVCDQGETPNDNLENRWVQYLVSEAPEGITYYYRIVDKLSTDQDFKILKDDQVKIDSNITKEMVAKINGAKPTLTFEAAAVQFANITADSGKSAVDVAFDQITWPSDN